MEIITRVGFVRIIDFLLLLLAVRIIYISISKGILIESFKTVGVVVSSFFSFHYYPYLIKNLEVKLPSFLKLLSFLLIFSGVYLIFYLIRKIVLLLLIKSNEPSLKERWFSLLLGGFRCAFVISLIVFLIYLSPKEINIQNSWFYIFKNIAPKTYFVFLNAYHKVNSKIELNKELEIFLKESTIKND